jgi:hypothetical protein
MKLLDIKHGSVRSQIFFSNENKNGKHTNRNTLRAGDEEEQNLDRQGAEAITPSLDILLVHMQPRN